jgi:hypothetical protein
MGSARCGSFTGPRLLAGALLCAAGAAAALDDPSADEPSARRPHSAPRLEITATPLPRLDRVDAPAPTQRLDLTYLPQRRSALGLAVGLSGLPASGPGSNVPAPHGWAAAGQPALDLGVHWRHTLDRNHRLDVTAWRRVVPSPQDLALGPAREPSYGARLELNVNAERRTGFVADRGFLGVQLQGGGRITVKRANGGPMVYYRTRF